MARPEDYVGKSFGFFQIEEHMSYGAEAEVYSCRHLLTERYYVLRLDIHDNNLWDNEPLIPPINASLEHNGAKDSWEINKHMRHANAVPYYGVRDNRYLIPVSSPFRVKGAWDIDQVLDAVPLNSEIFIGLMDSMGIYEDAIMAMYAEALHINEIGEENYKKRWEYLTGGNILMSKIRNSGLSIPTNEIKRNNILQLLSFKDSNSPELADNIFIKLFRCLVWQKMSLGHIINTLMCPHFRSNITPSEVRQIIQLFNSLQGTSFYTCETLNRNLLWLQDILQSLFHKPFDRDKEPEHFEEIEKQPNYTKYSLLLQMHLGKPYPVILLQPL
ncbi:hypothetical protein DesfrDRAFT_0827 [Solidesulfovibrio fructosivorans JJ]]|uniref:Uncharacterized protein n=1 Tax=Solidesulfovibrio fructosivorans JJ] TaxID=596151 RepID=E1JT78_SOLFR|nr:hypothetical protein [Solidesulfovibrio fructosivorans]EFL52338.1 hypothetical protein DesfrDRAFT_0827 [Solidesulfovibrio fructosivorans JJ]]